MHTVFNVVQTSVDVFRYSDNKDYFELLCSFDFDEYFMLYVLT